MRSCLKGGGVKKQDSWLVCMSASRTELSPQGGKSLSQAQTLEGKAEAKVLICSTGRYTDLSVLYKIHQNHCLGLGKMVQQVSVARLRTAWDVKLWTPLTFTQVSTCNCTYKYGHTRYPNTRKHLCTSRVLTHLCKTCHPGYPISRAS